MRIWGVAQYDETSVVTPVNWYGKQKVVAEYFVCANNYNVIRYPFLIGPSLIPDKDHFYDYIVTCFKKEQPVKFFTDYVRASLDFETAADITVRLMESDENLPPIMHVSADEPVSKYDIGLRIADKMGVNKELAVPIAMDENLLFNGKSGTVILSNKLL